jgi:hypothetical protein
MLQTLGSPVEERLKMMAVLVNEIMNEERKRRRESL